MILRDTPSVQLKKTGTKANINVLYFGSRGSVHKNVRPGLKGFGSLYEEAKATMK